MITELLGPDGFSLVLAEDIEHMDGVLARRDLTDDKVRDYFVASCAELAIWNQCSGGALRAPLSITPAKITTVEYKCNTIRHTACGPHVQKDETHDEYAFLFVSDCWKMRRVLGRDNVLDSLASDPLNAANLIREQGWKFAVNDGEEIAKDLTVMLWSAKALILTGASDAYARGTLIAYAQSTNLVARMPGMTDIRANRNPDGPEASAAVPALIGALRDPDTDSDVRRGAAEALGQVGPEASAAVPALIETLRDPDGYVRQSVARALGQIGAQAVPALIEALRDPDSDVRRGVTDALGRVGPEAGAAVPALIKALRDPDSDVLRGVAGALGRVGPEARAAVPALIEALRNPDSNVRRGVAFALGQIGAEADPLLIEALRDPDSNVRLGVAFALGYVRQSVADALGRLAPEASDAVSNGRSSELES